jgi:hypothetical protein
LVRWCHEFQRDDTQHNDTLNGSKNVTLRKRQFDCLECHNLAFVFSVVMLCATMLIVVAPARYGLMGWGHTKRYKEHCSTSRYKSNVVWPYAEALELVRCLASVMLLKGKF